MPAWCRARRHGNFPDMDRLLPTLLFLLLQGWTAHAFPGDARTELRQAVAASCLALLDDRGSVMLELADGSGTGRYGLAIVTVRTESDVERRVCVYDRVSRQAELSDPFDE